MGTEIVGAAGTASLTLAPNRGVGALIARTTKEIDLSPDQFALVEAVASSPPPVQHRGSQQEFKAIVGSMAVTLKAAKRSLNEGKFQLAVYWKILGHLPLQTLQHIAERAVREMVFMPTPAELLKLADDFASPEVRLHARARTLTRQRREREFEEAMARLRDGDMTQEEIDGQTSRFLAIAEARGHVRRLEGGRYTHRPRMALTGPETDIERQLKNGGTVG